jgi:hypothetical protein
MESIPCQWPMTASWLLHNVRCTAAHRAMCPKAVAVENIHTASTDRLSTVAYAPGYAHGVAWRGVVAHHACIQSKAMTNTLYTMYCGCNDMIHAFFFRDQSTNCYTFSLWSQCDAWRVISLIHVLLDRCQHLCPQASKTNQPTNRTVLYCTLLYSTVLYCTLLYSTLLYSTLLYCTVLYCTVLYCTVLYCTVLYCTVLYCTVFVTKQYRHT